MADPIRDFLQDANGDRAVVNGDWATVAGADAVPQGIAIRVRSVQGEIFLDEAQGVDYRGQILVKDPNPLVVREIIREAIADTPDVTDVVGNEPTLDNATREGAVGYAVATTYGPDPKIGTVILDGLGL